MLKVAIKNRGFFATAVGCFLLFIAMAAPALAVDALWDMNPGYLASGTWVTIGRAGRVPVNAGDTATFNTSTMTSLFLTLAVTIGSMTFNPGACTFQIDTSGNCFSFVGVGISLNNSGTTQTIINDVGDYANFKNNLDCRQCDDSKHRRHHELLGH